jgi:hypothetical protein
VRRPQRKRGYDDKGSLRRPDKLGLEYYKRPNIIPEEQIWIPTKISRYPAGFVEQNNLRQAALVELDSLRGVISLMCGKELEETYKRINELHRIVSSNEVNLRKK